MTAGTWKDEDLSKPGRKAMPEKKPEELKAKLRALVENARGKVVTISYDNNNRPTALLADIPAGKYKQFCANLNEIGRFVSPPPTAGMDRNMIRVLVRFKTD